ncbi:MerR family transcriptional regulator [Myxococcota bacterium]|nr:MerR family transcriptional regulator [Myxococcota bacterium]MCZ7619307.1 MerR family transcriptional regulator [Myxococcota bacterium]
MDELTDSTQQPTASDAANPEKRYYRIGEVAKLTGVKPHVLRYWESEFRWMAPAKSRTRQRMYRHRDIEVVRLLQRLLHEERFTIAGARRKLREMGIARALDKPQLDLGLDVDPLASLRRIREELKAIRQML